MSWTERGHSSKSDEDKFVLRPFVICIKKINETRYSVTKNSEEKPTETMNCVEELCATPRSRLQRKARTCSISNNKTEQCLLKEIQSDSLSQKDTLNIKNKPIFSDSSSNDTSFAECNMKNHSDGVKCTSPSKPFSSGTNHFSTKSKRDRIKRTLNFGSPTSKDVDVVTTRYGRKVKLTVNSAARNLDLIFSTPTKRNNYCKRDYYNSDKSDSEVSKYTPTDNSSIDESSNDEFLVDGSTDDELKITKNGPKPTRKSSRTPKHPSVKDPKCSKKIFNPVMPIIPQRQQPLKTPGNLLEESRQRLHVSAVPSSLPCRDEEYLDIYSFIESNLLNRTGGCMYISGVPGTGKTATVHEVLRNLIRLRDNKSLPEFQFIEINGMKMTDPYQCYVQIFKALSGQRLASQQAANMLEKHFTKSGPKHSAIILLVDELDKLWTRKQTVMYNIFDWPSKPSSKLIVLAIANTMDLPERMMMSRISSRLGLTRKIFQPYTFKELQEIIMSRIRELDIFDRDAVQLVARKVAAVSGDARRALEICRRAAEVAEEGSVVLSPSKKKNVLVGMAHIDIALNQMLSSPEVACIRGCSALQKVFFKALVSEFERTGSEETTLFKAYRQFITLCRFEGLHPPTTTDASVICAYLASSHLILIDNFQNDLFMKIRLSVSLDDVNYALNCYGC